MKAFNVKKIKKAIENEFRISMENKHDPNSFKYFYWDPTYKDGKQIGGNNVFELFIQVDNIELMGCGKFHRYSPNMFSRTNQILDELVERLNEYLPKHIFRASKLHQLGI